MKRIIDGKVYNTDTAEEYGSYSSGLSYSDFRYCEESLFKTRKGAWFLCGSGGPMTKWAKSCGNGTSGGSGIKVITECEALAWCERCDIDTDLIEANFKIEEA